MIERFCSNDFSGNFTAVCDNLQLPFWGIDCTFDDCIARPFAYEPLQKKLFIGKCGDGHGDLFGMTKVKLSYFNTVCGRFWNFNNIKILTFWTEEHEKNFLSANVMSDIVNQLENKGFNAKNAKIVFEAYDDNSLKQWANMRWGDVFFIYIIPVSEYISQRMTSFEDVVERFNIQEKKKKPQTANHDKYEEYGGYLPYKLLRYQSDECKINKNKNLINENILIDDLPNDIKSSLFNNTTSLGNNPAIPDVYDVPYLYKVANERFNEIKNTLSDIGTIDDFEDTEITPMLSKLINKCKEMERPFRNHLEKICINYVIDLFKIPEDTIKINVSLVDKVDLKANSIIVDPIDGNDDFQFDDVESVSNLRGEVYKRRILDALCMGESIILSSDIDSYYEEINKINPELCDLYFKIIALNNYSLFLSEDIGISDKNKSQLGTVNVEFGNEDQQVRITSQGEIFPVLLSETILGLLQLFISHGLPKDLKTAETVIGMSDFIKAEPWDMRLGPSLWIVMSKSFNNITFDELPYLLKRIASINVDDFNYFMKEVLAKTKKGRLIMSKICNKAKKDIQYTKFTDKMSKMKTDKSIITDEFINEDEL